MSNLQVRYHEAILMLCRWLLWFIQCSATSDNHPKNTRTGNWYWLLAKESRYQKSFPCTYAKSRSYIHIVAQLSLEALKRHAYLSFDKAHVTTSLHQRLLRREIWILFCLAYPLYRLAYSRRDYWYILWSIRIDSRIIERCGNLRISSFTSWYPLRYLHNDLGNSLPRKLEA